MDKRSIVIAAFLFAQSAGPIDYYFLRDDPYDERFAWRMFSPTRMTRCALDVRAGADRVDLDRRFHRAWIDLARRGRTDVVRAMTRRLCAESALRAKGVRARLECVALDGSRDVVLSGRRDECR